MTDFNSTKEKLTQAAIDLFSVKGFKGTSIRDIANLMGMSISNIYHYFGNKEGLWLAILETSAEKILEGLEKICNRDMEPLARLKMLIEAHLGLSLSNKERAKIFQMDEEHLTPEGCEINKQLQRRMLNIYVEELRHLKETGIVKCRSPKIFAYNILGVINWQLRWYRADDPLSREEVTEEIILFIMDGIKGPVEQ